MSPSIVSEIASLHGEILTAARTSLDKAIRIGELLAGIKADLAHGQWLPWLTAHVPFSDQTARNYIRVYEHRDDPKFKTLLNLADVYRLLAAPPEPDASEIEEQRIADYARFRVYELRLNSPNLTIKECRDIMNEATGMEDYWRKITLDAERNLGAVLNEAEALGVKDQVLELVNLSIKAHAFNVARAT
jgi:hypothetical protein